MSEQGETPKLPTDVVTVYSPAGEEKQIARANANDLVAHAGWSFKRVEQAVEDAVGAAVAAVKTVVYDLLGKAHEVSVLNAHDLVTHLGWSRKPPPAPEAEAPAPAADEPAPAPTTRGKKRKDDTPAPTPAPEPVDLTAMSREGLLRFAKENFDMEFDANVSNQAIIDAILAEQDK